MKKYTFHSQIISRIPLLPISLDLTKEAIIKEMSNKVIREAIYLSSPSLYHIYSELSIVDILNKKDDNKLLNSLRKYLMRMRTRCTPFGLFATCAVVSWGEENRVVLESDDTLMRKTRLDMQFLCELIQHIVNDEELRKGLLYYPNNSLYSNFNRYRYIESYFKDTMKFHQISSVRSSNYLKKILTASSKGKSLTDLAEIIVEENISYQEALEFVNSLVTAQLLVSDLEPNVTGTPIMERILQFLFHQASEKGNWLYKKLKDIENKLKELDRNSINGVSAYLSLKDSIQELGMNFEENKLIQTDSFRIISDGVLSSNIKRDLKKVCSLLRKLSRVSKETNLQIFKNNFFERYEYDEKPLSEVLDTESGIGYLNNNKGADTPFIDGINTNGIPDVKMNWAAHDKFLFGIAYEATLNDKIEINLSDYENEINKLAKNSQNLPVSMSVMFNILESVEKPKILFTGAFGPSAIQLIGRFAGSHKEINKIVDDISKHEETYFNNQNIELAEIVHLPESRAGNILFRPSFRKYEIPYLANSLLDKEFQLDIADLLVSVKNDEVVLRSKKLNKRILPRLGNAHNYQYKALPVYQFLADLQFQNSINGLSFNWGELRQEFFYLPKIIYNNVILARAEWNFPEKEITKFKSNPSQTIKIWKEAYHMPKKVFFVSGDNELPINFEDPLSVQMLISELKKYKFATFKEYLFSEKNALVKDKNGRPYTNEFIAFLLKEKEELNHSYVFNNKRDNTQVCRNFYPGDDWLYFKIYCGFKIADKVLAEYMLPFTQELADTKRITKWFFIRYMDPKPHIRFRVLVKNKKDISDIIVRFNKILKTLTESNLVYKVQLDTYARELERYGANTIHLAESIFALDSIAISNFLTLIEGETGEKYRWFFAILSIDTLLHDFRYNIDEKLNILTILSESFAKEFQRNKVIKDQINSKYRKYRKEIEGLFTEGSDIRTILEPAIKLLENRSEQVSFCVLEYRKLQLLKSSIQELIGSFIHMTCNRIFISNQRKHEFVLYDFMYKYYKGIKFRKEKKKSSIKQSIL